MLPTLYNPLRWGVQAFGVPKVFAGLISSSSEALQAAKPASGPAASKAPLYKEFQLYRWNPDTDDKPKYVSYQVDINNCGPMMLDVLLKIKDEQDQAVSFRRSCR